MALSNECKRRLELALTKVSVGSELATAVDANTLKTSYVSTHNTWMNSVINASDTDSLEVQVTKVVSAAAADGYAGGIRLDGGYSGSTVSRHNYIDLQTPSTSGMLITTTCVLRFDADTGTHPATTTDTSAVLAGAFWINVNGLAKKVLYYDT